DDCLFIDRHVLFGAEFHRAPDVLVWPMPPDGDGASRHGFPVCNRPHQPFSAASMRRGWWVYMVWALCCPA
ncbi:MAG TPA: hypothetical protein VII92_02020, partial [Anaerolineae bacterium]